MLNVLVTLAMETLAWLEWDGQASSDFTYATKQIEAVNYFSH